MILSLIYFNLIRIHQTALNSLEELTITERIISL